MSFQDLAVDAVPAHLMPDDQLDEIAHAVVGEEDHGEEDHGGEDHHDTKLTPAEIDKMLAGGGADGADGLRSLMRKYAEEFGEELSRYQKLLESDTLAIMSPAQLQQLRDKCNLELCGGGSVDAMCAMINFAISGAEKLASSAGYDCTGAAAELARNKSFQQRGIRRVSLMYMQPGIARPEVGVAMQIGQAFVAKYLVNSSTVRVAAAAPPVHTSVQDNIDQNIPQRLF